MERIKRIEEVQVGEGYILVKMYMRNKLIVAPDSKGKHDDNMDYAEVITVGPNVTDIKEGDITLGIEHAMAFNWHGQAYAILPRMGIKYFIKPDNFDNGRKGTDGLEFKN